MGASDGVTNHSKYEVVICGSGSAALLAAIALAQAGINFCILEKRDGPLSIGQADGVQCRTVEIFDSLGKAEELLREAYHVLDLSFWSDTEDGSAIIRTSTAADTPPGLSHLPHVILNQARVNGLLLEKMLSLMPDAQMLYDHQVVAVNKEPDTATGNNNDSFPVQIDVQHGKEIRRLYAKYALACDGAHSTVRKSLGISMLGESSDAVWGVIDLIPNTNFPDIRRKTTIHSRNGSIVIIPREGDQLVRFYLQLPTGTTASLVTSENLINRAKIIMCNYSFDAAKVTWWSAYTIGQRLASDFCSKSGRIFLAGDACHTHSPKAGQGMNVSLQDGYNIGWKLAHILQGRALPSILRTYIDERQIFAKNLIEFDRQLTDLYLKSKTDATSTHSEFKDYFLEKAAYMAGLSCKYEDTLLTNSHDSKQEVARNMLVGTRCPSAEIVRYIDGKGLHLQRILRSDNRWRVMVFLGDLKSSATREKLNIVSAFLTSEDSPLIRYRRSDSEDIDAYIEPILISASSRFDIELSMIPDVFRPVTGPYQISDLSKIYTDEKRHDEVHGQAFEALGIDPGEGAVVVIRPDQHISLVVHPKEVSVVGAFFSNFACRL